MKVQTNIYQDHYKKWVAESTVMISEERRLELSLRTYKTDNGYVVSNASVSQITEDGFGKTHMMFQDFSERLLENKYGRVTEKVIREQHGLVDLESVVGVAKKFYNTGD